jgi:hypothetical protein
MSSRPAARASAEIGGIRGAPLGALRDAAGRAGVALALLGGADLLGVVLALAVVLALEEARAGVGVDNAAPSGAGAWVQPALAATTNSPSIRHRNATIGSSFRVDDEPAIRRLARRPRRRRP